MATYLLFCLGFILFVANVQSESFLRDQGDYIFEYPKEGYIENSNPLGPTFEDEYKKPLVTLFYESMCPGCRRFHTTYFSELVSKLGQHIYIKSYAYGKAATTIYYNRTLTFWCQHGEPECYGNKLHRCAKIYIHENSTQNNDENYHLLFNSCLMEFDRSENGSNDKAVDECGSKMNIDVSLTTNIKNCANNSLGSMLLKYSGIISVNAKYTSLPHIEINNEHWTGKHEDLIKDVCATFANPPEPCKDFIKTKQ